MPTPPPRPISRHLEAQTTPRQAGSLLGRLVPPGLRPLARDALHAARVARAQGRYRRHPEILAQLPHRWLHLGCADVYKRGWINIDQFGSDIDFAWDLRRPLPLPSGSVEAIFHEHLLEHLPAAEGMSLIRECHRLLRPGGILRIGVPDFGAYARSYVDGGAGFIATVRPDVPTPLLAVAEVAYDYGHRSLWDETTLVGLLEEVGFSARACAFGESALDDVPDSEHRRDETLYVEGVKEIGPSV